MKIIVFNIMDKTGEDKKFSNVNDIIKLEQKINFIFVYLEYNSFRPFQKYSFFNRKIN